MILWAYEGPNGLLTDLTGIDGVDETGIAGTWMPTYELLARDVPSGSGTVTTSSRGKPRTVTVPIVVQDARTHSARLLDERMRRLADALAPEDGAGLLLATSVDDDGAVILDPDTGDPMTRTLRCWFTGGFEVSRSWSEEYGGWWQIAGLVFEADQPYYLPRYPRTRTFRSSLPVDWFPILPVHLGSDSTLGASTERNDGAVPAFPVWTITTPGTSFTATNLTTGETLTVDTTAAGGQTVTVDTRPTYLGGGRSVSLADGTSLYDRLSGALWALVRGDNALAITVVGATPGVTQVDLDYSPLYRTP